VRYAVVDSYLPAIQLGAFLVWMGLVVYGSTGRPRKFPKGSETPRR
jgi:hypothetical protein